jgi:hypothetical protein
MAFMGERQNLLIDREWELRLVDKVCDQARLDLPLASAKIGVLQLSYEYSGLVAQLLAHKLSVGDGPLDIEPVNIPYRGEFPVVIHPNQLDPYEALIVVDSGCLTGRNFAAVERILLDYGFRRDRLWFCCLAADLNGRFKPDCCPLWFNGDTHMVHFWWETKTTHFNAK